MRKLLSQNKGVVWFSLFKYIEIGVTALTTFLLAKKLGPLEMGLAMPVLLYITYANYLALGVNQVVTKNLSRYSDQIKIRDFITINLQFIGFVSVLNVILSCFILNQDQAILAAIISICVIMRGFFSSYFRAIYRVRVLNKNNLIFSIFLLILVLTMVSTLRDYLMYWAICVGGALILYFFDDKKFFYSVLKNILSIQPRKEILFNLKEGVKLALTGLLTTILLTSDRLIINKMDIPTSMKGSYQLADYAGTAAYMFFTTIFFYFYPKWIESIRNSQSFRNKFIRYVKISLFSVPICLIVVFFLSKVVNIFIFPEYRNLDTFISLSVYIKLSVVYLGLIALFYVGVNQETRYLKSLKFLLSSLALILFILMYLKVSFFWIPLAIGTLIFVEVIRKIFMLSKDVALSKS